MATQREYLVEMTVRVDSSGTTDLLTYSVFGFNSRPTDATPNRHYAPRLVRPGVLSLSLFRSGSTTGTRVGFGGVQLANTDGGLDGLIDYGFAGGAIRVLSADRGSLYSQFEVLFTGVMEQPVFDWNSVTISVRDNQSNLTTQLVQQNVYAGTNSGSPLSGVEGTASDIKGARKPLVFGSVNNVRAVCVNTDRNIYQVHDGSVAAISAVYAAGASQTAGATYADLATMQSTAPTAGQFRALPSLGLFRLGTATNGVVTADVQQGASAADRTVAQVLKAIAVRAGISSGSISSTDVTALDAACPQEVGVAVASEASASSAAAMADVARSVGAWWGFDYSGQMRLGRLTEPSGTPVVSLDDTNVVSISRRRSADQGEGVPAWRVKVLYARNQTVQATGLAASVTTARAAYLARRGRESVAEDAAVKTKHPLAVEMSFDTLLTAQADADTEAARLLALYKVRRDTLAVGVRLTPAQAKLVTPGAIVRLTLGRYGMSGGRLFLVTEAVFDYSTDGIDLTLWG